MFMRLFTFLLMLVTGLVTGAPCASPIQSPAISIHSGFNWPEMVKDAPSPTYVWPPFATPFYSMPMPYLKGLQEAGFKTVRLTVGLGIFLTATPAQQKELDALLKERVTRLRNAGVNVIVDFHPVKQDKRVMPITFTQSVDDPQVLQFRELLKRTAKMLAAFPTDKVALELLNEPEMKTWNDDQVALWQQVQETYYRDVRSVAPKVWVILSGCCGGSLEGLQKLNPAFADARTAFSFHYYKPFAFTHQGVIGDPTMATRFFSKVPFPLDEAALVQTETEAMKALKKIKLNPLQRIEARLNLAKSMADIRGTPNAQAIEADFDKVAAWAKANGIAPSRIFMGEFGVMRARVPEESRVRWLQTMVSLADKKGFAWAYWSADQPEYMGLTLNKNGPVFDPVILQGLGLKAPTEASRPHP
jgi:endoglucanase